MDNNEKDIAGTVSYDSSSGVNFESSPRANANLFGTLEIEGDRIYYVFVSQSKIRKTWYLIEREYFNEKKPVENGENITAVLRMHSSGVSEGLGKTHLITRLLENISLLTGRASQANQIKKGFFVTCEWQDGNAYLNFQTYSSGSVYSRLQMAYEGFKLNLEAYGHAVPIRITKKFLPLEDDKTKAAMIAGLGVSTFSLLKQRNPGVFDWLEKKRYKLIDSNEKFREMMLEFLRDVQTAAQQQKTIVVGLDTETTGLNMVDLAPSNPYRDYVVAIPFSWKDDEGYVICTQMYYFGNVDEEEVYPLFDKLFSRNKDYTYQDIKLSYEGEEFSFNRANITVVGANAGFDIRAFLCHGAHVFFDEDIQIMHYNFATDWVQGKNSLKYMTHRYLGDQTLELEDLFGKNHKDKYRYISDPQLALVYGGADADYTRLLYKKFRRIMSKDLYYLYKKYDITLLYRCAIATWEGLPVDSHAVREQGRMVQQDLETLKEFIYRYAYAANRSNLEEKAGKLADLLGVGTHVVEEIGEEEKMYRYPFTPANHKNLLFNILRYPVIKTSAKSQEPALDKYVLKKLASVQREEPVDFLKEDVPSLSDPSEPLIKKEQFNSDKYPLARVFQTYAKLNKEYTSYYKPIMANDLEGKMFYSFTLQRAATRRILNPGQTMKGSLKKLVVAPAGKLFMTYDASQIEYRHMASLAYIQTKSLLQKKHPEDWEERLQRTSIYNIFNLMQKPEADYHIETAAMMTGKPQYKVSHSERKLYKGIGFGIPYGLGDRSMCESLFGRVTKENMAKTKEVLADYKRRQAEIIRLLETTRDSAFVPAPIPDELREMLDIGETPVGIVRNFTGFYRLFILEELTRARTGRIRRQAGNCIIQGGAAELFRRMLYNFYLGCVKAGIEDKVQWKMLVHDEVDCTVDADIDICKLIQVAYENCTLRYEDHIPYYIGIGFGHNWADAKDDAAELPVIMVDRLVNAYKAGKFSIPSDGMQAENLLKLKRHYMCDRIYEELRDLGFVLEPGHQWTDREIDYISENFTNYIVRAYLPSFVPKDVKKQYGKDDVPLKVMLECWMKEREQYGIGVDFLQTKLKDARATVTELMLDDDNVELSFDANDVLEDLQIELLENSEDDLEVKTAEEENSWFHEDSLFDYSLDSEDIVSETSEREYASLLNDFEKEDDGFVLNEKPTNAFDVFVSSRYVRKHVFTSNPSTYTVMLSGTPHNKKSKEVAQLAKKLFAPGDKTLIIIGNQIIKLQNLDLVDEKLDELDKVLCEASKLGV